MTNEVVFYHAGCPVCVSAEQHVLSLVDSARYAVKVVHLGEQSARIAEAERVGVKSVPAMVVGGQVLHINFGASLEDVKKS